MKKIILIILMSFISLAGYCQLPALESFEGTTFPPAGWLVTDNGAGPNQSWKFNAPNPPYTAYDPAATGKAAFVDRENTGLGVLAEEWLITPQQNVGANQQLRFFTRQTLPGDTGTRYQIRVSTNATQANLGAYTTLVDYSETDLSTLTVDQLDYEEKVVNLAAGNQYIAFVKVFTQPTAATGGDRWLVDAVKIVQRCVEPTNLNVDCGVSATTVCTAWSGPTGATYTLEYGPSGFAPGTGSGIVITGITSPTYTITGLNPSTDYQFYVTAVCGSLGSSSEQVGPFNVTTASLGSTCAGPITVTGLPYSTTDNTLQYGNNINSGTPGSSCGGGAGFLAGNDVVYAYTVPATTTGFINITMNPNGATNTGVFVYNSCANVGINCIAGVGNANSNIRTIPSLAVTPGQTIYIVISSTNATPSFGYTLIIQNVNCAQPIALGLTTVSLPATNPTTHEALLKWANGTPSNSTSWQVVVQAAGTPIPSFAGVTTNNNINFPASTAYYVGGVLTPGQLPADTSFEFWVRADCGNGTFSAWSGPFQFNTLPTCPQPTALTTGAITSNSIAITFTNNSTATSFNVFALPCGSPAPTAASTGFLTTGSTPYTITGLNSDTCYDIYVRANCGAVDGSSQWTPLLNLQTQIVPPACGGTYVDLGGSNGDYPLNADSTVTICPTNAGDLVTVTFTQFETESNYDGILVYDGNSTGAPQISSGNDVGFGGPLADIPGAFWGTTIPGPFTSSSLDGCLTFRFVSDDFVVDPGFLANVTCSPAPACPKSTTIAATNIATTSATISWLSPPNATSFEILVLPAGSPPPTDASVGTPISGSPYNLTGLAVETCYDVYIRNNCGADGLSVWSTAFANFCTLPTCPKPTALALTNVLSTSAQISFTNNSTATSFDIIVLPCGSTAPTSSSTPTYSTSTISNYLITPLNPDTCYDIYVRANCGPGDLSSWAGPATTTTQQIPPACGGTFSDLGGSSANYPDNADSVVTICPTTPGDVVTVTFTQFVTENNFDGILVYDGNSTAAPQIPSTNGVGFGPFTTLPGAYWGTALPGPFESTSVDGCLTFHFLSDGSVNNPGFLANVTCAPTPPCQRATAVTSANITINSATISWTSPANAVSYEVLALPAGSPQPAASVTGVPAATNPFVLTGLTPDTCYDVYVRNVCGGTDGVSVWSFVHTSFCTLIVPPACGGVFSDLGGAGANYPNGADSVVTICPTNPNDLVTVTFTSFNTEANFDGLLVYDGNSISSPQIPSANGPGFGDLAALPGAFWGTTIPGPFTSSNFNGCLTFHFISDDFANDPGWTANVTCEPAPTCQRPLNVTATNVGTFDATISWLAPANAVSFEVLALPAGSPPPTDADSGVPAASSPFVLTGLSSLTCYDVYVKNNCGATDGFSHWSLLFASFCTLPTCPQPTDLTIIGNDEDSATISFTAVGAATQYYIIIQPLGGPIPDANSVGQLVTATPTGTPPTITIDTADYGGGLVAGFYEIYVQAVCTAPDESTWNGPEPFFISPPPPACADVTIPGLITNPPGVLNFCAGQNCVDLTATYTPSGDTTTYNVLSIAYAPPFPFTGGTQLSIDQDDIWGTPFTLPFNFCYFGTNYPAVQVGSNGVVSFTTTYPPGLGGQCQWNTDPAVTVPNPAFPILNAIYGVYQDTDPTEPTPVPHSINYQVLGTAPCRSFVINYYELGQYQCGVDVGTQTSQIVLYETSNIIEVYVRDRTVCTTWNEGSGVIGIQDVTGTQAFVPPGRNLGPWEAHNEGWRFTPAGPSNVTFSWLQNGAFLSNDTSVTVCFTETTSLTAQAVYTGCGGTTVTKTQDVLLQVNEIDVPHIDDITSCEPYALPELPNVTYYSEAGGLGDPITVPIETTQTVYAYGSTPTTPSCHDEESFTVTIGSAIVPPLDNVSDCQSYTLPDLTILQPGFTGNYYTELDGNGSMYPGTGGTVIDTPGITTLYIYVVNGTCVGQGSFEINIGPITAAPIDDVAACNSYVLPDLPDNNTYYTLPGGPLGGGVVLAEGDVITTPGTYYVWAQDGDCTDQSDFVVTFDGIIPTFDPIPNICLNATPPTLPTTSTNNIIGSWSPATIDTTVAGTFVFTFSPDTDIEGQECAVVTTLSVTIDAQIVPTFTGLVTDICLNAAAPSLPLISSNGISGTWSTIDTSVAGPAVVTFTPDPIPSQACAVPVDVTFNINSQIVPTFDPIANVCQNATAPVLPLVSLNGITGTWSCVIDTSVAATTICTFTPDITIPGQECATTTTLNITVDPALLPTFAPIANICLGDAAPALPNQSIEGIAGTFFPLTIDTSVAGTFTFTFTPTVATCTSNGSVTVTVNAPTTPGFTDLTVCSGTTPPLLSTTSPNGVIGTWQPATIDNVNGGTYIFTPDAGQCATPQSIVVSITPSVIPTFNAIAAICSGDAAPALPTQSLNGINGTWLPTTINTSVAGTFTYAFTPNVGQCASPTTLSVVINQSITPDFDLTEVICSGATAPVLQTTSPNGVTGTWNPSTVSNSQDGDYIFTPDAGQCADSVTLHVTVNEVPVFALQGACNGNDFVLSIAPGSSIPDNATYIWTNASHEPLPNGNGPTVVVTSTGDYTLTVSTASLCPSEQTYTANSVACTIQKGISPKGSNGGDGKNDYFDLVGRNVRKLEIFNRYGTEVYSLNNYGNEWYGQSDKGNELPDGTYYYVIEYNYAAPDVTGWIYINREQ